MAKVGKYSRGTASVKRTQAATASRASAPKARSATASTSKKQSGINYPAWMKKSYKASK